jgi:hypothetical protein
MRLKKFFRLPAAIVIASVLSTLVLQVALAAELVVPTTYAKIQDAIDAAFISGDSVVVEPGTYNENVTLKNGVSIRGRETARTILSGGGSGTIITANNISTSTVVKNLTLISATVGIAVTNSSALEIKNNVFRIGSSSTAITTSSSATTKIMNNVFHSTGNAISTTTDLTLNIINNIFSNYTTAFSETIATNNILNNLFTGTAGVNVDTTTKGNITSQDPLFVDPDNQNRPDFHLMVGTPCKDKGNSTAGNDAYDGTSPPDIGAYGGTFADTIPYIVSNFAKTDPYDDLAHVGAFAIDFTWSGNQSYLLTDPALPGGYRVHYGLNKSGPPYASTKDAGKSLSITIDNLVGASAPTAPTLTITGYANETLKLKWSEFPGATGYIVYYTDLGPIPPAPPQLPGTEQSIDVMNTTVYNLSGLINLHNYQVEVAAYIKNTYYFAVTAYDNAASTRDPGIQHESAYSTPEQTADIGSTVVGTRSAAIPPEYPEAVIPNPNLLNKGCFIATAAYGYYSAPQVQALREFRDRYLMTNAPGRAFVRWYYQHGPAGAQFINDHPWLKPFVRTALMPAVGGAMFMTRTSMITKTLTLFMFVLFVTYLIRRTRRSAEICGKIIKRKEKP